MLVECRTLQLEHRSLHQYHRVGRSLCQVEVAIFMMSSWVPLESSSLQQYQPVALIQHRPWVPLECSVLRPQYLARILQRTCFPVEVGQLMMSRWLPVARSKFKKYQHSIQHLGTHQQTWVGMTPVSILPAPRLLAPAHLQQQILAWHQLPLMRMGSGGNHLFARHHCLRGLEECGAPTFQVK